MRSFSSASLYALCLSSTALSLPFFTPRQSPACFIIGSDTLPAETQAAVDAVQSSITCDASRTTISGVLDVSTSTQSFSNMNFAASNQTPLQFALSEFATSTPLASSDLNKLQDQLDLHEATEAGIRSVGGNLAIKVPKYFLAFQIARVKTAQGIQITDAGQTVDHLLGKVQTNAAGEDQALLDQLTALSTQLS